MKHRVVKLFWILNFSAFALFRLFSDAVVQPSIYELSQSDINEGRFSMEIRIVNDYSGKLAFSVLSGGAQWVVSPGELLLFPGEEGSLSVEGPVPGEEPVSLIFLADREDFPSFYSIYRPGGLPESGVSNGESEGRRVFFYTPGCAVCEEFYSELLPRQEQSGVLEGYPEKRNIYENRNYELMNRLLEGRGVSAEAFPILIWEDHVFTGEAALFEDFPRFLENPSAFGKTSDYNPVTDPIDAPSSRFFWLTLLLAGLLDGINPCAFTTLIFLISYLRLLGRKGRDILKIGGSFTLSVFLSYFLIGLGMFQVFQLAQSFHAVSRILRWGMILMLILLSVLSFYDYWKVRMGRAEDSLLQLGGDTKKKIHRVVRKSSRSRWLILSSIGAGFVISLYELGCTGQIYLPMVAYMVKNNPEIRTVIPLLLYNTGFIIPLVAVFFLFYKGTDSKVFTIFFQKHLGKVKLATALFFSILALFLFLN